jgi:hypothetical protein
MENFSFFYKKLHVTACIGVLIFSLDAYAEGGNDYDGGGTNWGHEIQLFNIENYGMETDKSTAYPFTEIEWKSSYAGYYDNAYQQVPYRGFWETIHVNCTTSSCSSQYSDHWKDSEVTVDRMVNNGVNDFKDADMVVFHGHNKHIVPNYHTGDFWGWRPFRYPGSPAINGWQSIDAANFDENNWGTSSEPYYYNYPDVVTNADTSPAAVFYAYNPMTSVLMGRHFVDGTWNAYNEWQCVYDPVSCNAGHSGKMNGDTEWFIANGCSAVPVAQVSGNSIVSDSLGAQIWSKVWGRLHLVLGHYTATYATDVPNMVNFAYFIKNSVPVKDAYFDSHYLSTATGSGLPSAITANSYDDCCGTFGCNATCLRVYFDEDWNNVLPTFSTSDSLVFTSVYRTSL